MWQRRRADCGFKGFFVGCLDVEKSLCWPHERENNNCHIPQESIKLSSASLSLFVAFEFCRFVQHFLGRFEVNSQWVILANLPLL
ncbi:hypothetical protein YC2023_083606 [Brassica napus]